MLQLHPSAARATPGGHTSIAWPVALLYSGNKFSGFMMPRIAKSYPLLEVFNPHLRNSQSLTATWRDLHRIGRNLSSVFASVHSTHGKGISYVIGDVNQKNSLVAPNSLVTIIDADSFQVVTPNGIYKCPVGVPEFTPPELQGKDLRTVHRENQHDLFGLAVLIFQLLMEGHHPFMGIIKGTRTSLSLAERIRQGTFPYPANSKISPPPSSPKFEDLHIGLQQLFQVCFTTGQANPSARPTATEWKKALKNAEADLISCSRNKHHWYSRHVGNCPHCKRPVAKKRPTITKSPVQRQRTWPAQQPQPRTIAPANPSRGNWLGCLVVLSILSAILLIWLSGNSQSVSSTASQSSEGLTLGNSDSMPFVQQASTPTLRSFTAPTQSQSVNSCRGAPPQRLEANEDAIVCTQSDNVYLRSGPSLNFDIIRRAPPGTVVWVLEGASCANNWSWWKVQLPSGIIGWMSEGGDSKDPYFLCPN